MSPRRPERILFTCHDAGGTVPPMLALAEALVARDHSVIWLGQPSIEQRVEAVGCEYVPFDGIPSYEPRVALEDQLSIAGAVLVGAEISRQFASLAADRDVALSIVDANLATCLSAAEASDRPSAVLLHSMYATFTETWMAEYWPLLAPPINDLRADAGLDAVASWADLFAGQDRIISVVPEPFDQPLAARPASMRHWGFLVPGTSVGATAAFPAGDGATVLVGLSTTYAGHDHILQEILDGLAGLDVRVVASTAGQVDIATLRCPENVELHEYVDHGALLAHCDLMITHAGLGSVAAALSHAVPLVCLPQGRDQHLNAGRVASLGAGIDLGNGPHSSAAIALAVQHLLADPSYRRAAARIADQSARAGGAGAAVDDLEALGALAGPRR